MKYLLAFFFLFITLSVCSQNSVIDSLNLKLAEKPSDSLRLEVLINLGFEYRNIDSKKSLQHCQEAYKLAQQLGLHKSRALRNVALAFYKTGEYDTAIVISKKALELARENNKPREEADAYNTLGNIYYFKGEYLRSVDAFNKTIPIYDSLKRPIDKAGNLANMGVILENQGKFTEALINFQKALNTFNKEKYETGKALALFSIANIYDAQGLNENALEYFNRAAEIDKKTGDLVGYATTLSNIAGTQTKLGDTLKALYKYRQAIKIYKQAGADCRQSNVLSNLGKIYDLLNQSDSAKYYLDKAINLGAECEDKASLIQSYRDLGDYHSNRNNYTSALNSYRKSYELAKAVDLKPEIASSAAKLFLAHKTIGQFQQALEYFEISADIEKEIYNEKNTRELTRLEAEYLFEQEKNQIHYENQMSELRLKEKIEQQNKLQLYTSLFLIVLAILSIIIGRLYFLKRKNNAQLVTTNEEVKSQNEEILQQQEYIEQKNRLVEDNNQHLKSINEEKNALIGIVAHDLKSPLNQIKGLISLLINDAENKDEYMRQIEKAAERSSLMVDRVLDISAIENKEIKVVKQLVDISEVIEEVKAENQVLARKKSITIESSTPKIPKIKTDPLLVKEIIDNLLSNAIKYSPENSLVEVTVNVELKKMLINVKDNGPGISPDDQEKMFNKYQRLSAQPTGGETSSGLGLAIVKRYTEELNGKIYCSSELGKGSIFTLELPQ